MIPTKDIFLKKSQRTRYDHPPNLARNNDDET